MFQGASTRGRMGPRARTCQALPLALPEFDTCPLSAAAVDPAAKHTPPARMRCDDGEAGPESTLYVHQHTGAQAGHMSTQDHNTAHDANDAHDEHGVTPLVQAAMQNDLAGVRRLLRARASPHVPDSAGHPPLLVAVRGRRLAIARALVEAGARECAGHKLLPHALRTQVPPLVVLVLRAGCDYTLPAAPIECMRSIVEAAVRERWLAVLMSLHARLGASPGCSIRVLPPEVLQHVCLRWLCPAWLRGHPTAID